MILPAARVGFFGKLPSRGDFVRSALSRALVEAWDRWWQALLPAARDHLGEAWSDVWHATRPWRFAICPGLCGDQPVSGVWLASADKVGRAFPLTIATETFVRCDGFFDAAEDLGLEAIRNHMPPDALAHRLSLLPRPSPPTPPVDPASVHWWRRRESDGGRESFRADRLPEVDAFVGMLTP